MLFPVQAAPIDRANRAFQGVTSSAGMNLQQPPINPCFICDLLPAPIGGICKILCPAIVNR